MATSTEIKLSTGSISGQILTGSAFSKRKYYAFKGIPYAQPPVGKLRFCDPQPLLPWHGVLGAVNEGPSCPQKHPLFREPQGQEDNCLVLNVYTPQVSSSSEPGLPVLVWLHGGGFTFGSGNSDFQGPDYWMEKDVLLVTCNYRLGAFGFLSLGTEEVPGNAGLKDQVMVLRWVRQNIQQFGGDPHCVTIIGESAGAASVHYHLLSPMSRGLFHRAILMSGSSLNSWAHCDNPVERSYSLGERLGHKASDTNDLLTFLQSVPAHDIVKVQNKVVTAQYKQNYQMFPFLPCEEPEGGQGERFLIQHPRILLEQGLVAPVPLIIGYTDKEGMIALNDTPHSEEYFKTIDRNFLRIVPNNFGFLQNASDKIKSFFFEDKPINWETVDAYLNYQGDIMVSLHVDDSIKLHVAHAAAPVYCYSFKYDGGLGFLSHLIRQLNPDAKLPGVCHADDQGYMFKFNIPGFPQLEPGSADSQMVSHVTTLFTNFAKNGDPNGSEEKFKWEPAVKVNNAWSHFLELDLKPSMKHCRLEADRMNFWQSLRQPPSRL